MLPQNSELLRQIESTTYYPSLTYKLDFDNKRIIGYATRQEAVEQSLKLMTLVERYKYDIFDDDYGIETNDLIGKDQRYVLAVIESRIKDACSIDERILDLYDFETRVDYDTLYVTFKLKSVYQDETEQSLVFKGLMK